MKDMGVVSHIIGWDVEINCNSVYFYQRSYIETLYMKYMNNESNQTNNPMSTKTVSDGFQESDEVVECKLFRGLVDALTQMWSLQ
jgi:hypothetical protein